MRLTTLILYLLLPIFCIGQSSAEQKFCFCFFDKFGAEVTPSEMLVLDNTGGVFNLDSSKCFRHKADTSYSFILQVTDRDYYFFQKQYDANEMSGCDTVRLENMECINNSPSALTD